MLLGLVEQPNINYNQINQSSFNFYISFFQDLQKNPEIAKSNLTTDRFINDFFYQPDVSNAVTRIFDRNGVLCYPAVEFYCYSVAPRLRVFQSALLALHKIRSTYMKPAVEFVDLFVEQLNELYIIMHNSHMNQRYKVMPTFVVEQPVAETIEEVKEVKKDEEA